MDVYAGGEPFDSRKLGGMYLRVTALALEPAFLAFVLWFMGRGGWEGEPDGLPPVVVGLFALMSLAALPMGIWLRKKSMAGRGDFTVQKSRYSTKTITYTGAEAGMARITGGALAGMAMQALPALYGFVLGFMFQDWLYFLPFVAYSVLGILVMYPRPAQVRTWHAEQMTAICEPGAIPPPPL